MGKKAIIAGGGIAGLAAAIFLDELGYEVRLYERRPILGGRAYSFQDKKTGLVVDNGQHLLIGAYHETISLIEKLGVKHKLDAQIPTVVPLYDQNCKRNNFSLKAGRPPFQALRALAGFQGLSITDKIRLIRLYWDIKKIKKDGPNFLSNITVREWLKNLRQSEWAQNNFWDILTLATLNDTSEQTTADGLACVLSRSFFSGRNDGFLIIPRAGLSELFALPALRYLELRGQGITVGMGIKEIRIIDGMFRSVRLADGTEEKADLLVSALPPRALAQVLPQTFVRPGAVLSGLHRMQGSPIVSIHLFFDRPVLVPRFAGSAGTRTHWFFNQPVSAIEGQQNLTPSHVVGVISGAYDLLEKDKQEIVAMACGDLEKISPLAKGARLIHALVIKEREATLASRPGVNALRPRQRVLENFYVVGDWTHTGLPATIESAVKSARLMADELD